MKWTASITHPKPMRLEITLEPLFDLQNRQVGAEYRLVAFDARGVGMADSHQDTLAFAQEIALEDYQVPLDAWRQVE